MRGIRTGRKYTPILTVFAVTVGVATFAAGLVLFTSEKNVSASQWNMVWHDEFNGPSVSSEWEVVNVDKDISHNNGDLAFTSNNVSIKDNDYLALKTYRHCVANQSDALTSANISENPCPSGKITRYSSGKVRSAKVVDGAKPFRAEIRAKLDWNGKNGTRPALWMRNTQDSELQKCNTQEGYIGGYGEIDITEWYMYMPGYTWSSTHAGCYHHGVTETWTHGWKTKVVNHVDENPVGNGYGTLAYDWHTWVVEYDGQSVKYFLDGRAINAYHYHASEENKGEIERTPTFELSKLGNEAVQKTFNDMWYFILQDYVEKEEAQKPSSPTETFPSQVFYVDHVRLFQQGEAGTGIAVPDSTEPNSGVAWEKQDTQRKWAAVVTSSDGTKLAAAVQGDNIYISSDSGKTWTPQASSGSRKWVALAGSDDGQRLAALYDWGGYIVTSSDGGKNWTLRGIPGAVNWTDLTSSADGSKLVAVAKNSVIYTSNNAGASWTQQEGSGKRNWIAVASSADGAKLVAAVQNGTIYTSVNSGVTWTERSGAGVRKWTSVASSADGTKLVATADGGYIYTSVNSGATWTAHPETERHNWTSVASSADGTKLAAVVGGNGGHIYLSNDSGATWAAQSSAGTPNWSSIAMSAGGNNLAAVANGGNLFVSSRAALDATSDEVAVAQAAVDKAKATGSPIDVAAAEALLAKVQDATKKNEMQNQLNQIKKNITDARNALSSLISKAQSISTDGMTAASTGALQNEISSARQVNNNQNATLAELISAKDKLQEKLDALRADKTNLDKATGAANSEPDYIKNRSTVKQALNAAKSIQNATNPTPAEIKTATDNLNKAVADAKKAETDAQTAAQAAVDKAKDDKTTQSKTDAQALINKVGDSQIKSDLQRQLDAIVVLTTTSRLSVPQDNGSLVITSSGDVCQNIASGGAAAAPQNVPAGFDLRETVEFKIDCTGSPAQNGYSTKITLELTKKYADNAVLKVFKYDANGLNEDDITANVAFGVSADGNRTTVSYTVKDGGFGDQDNTVNGTIVDPVAVYERAPNQGGNIPGSGGGNSGTGGLSGNQNHQNTGLNGEELALSNTGTSIVSLVVGALATITLGGGLYLVKRK